MWSKRLLAALLFVFGVAAMPLLLPGNRLILRARLGNPKAMQELGIEYRKISNAKVRRDIHKSAFWLKKAAEGGELEAYRDLGQMLGMTPEGPMHWFLLGAGKGNPGCMVEVAKAYQYGVHGVKRDPKKAREWWDRANATQ